MKYGYAYKKMRAIIKLVQPQIIHGRFRYQNLMKEGEEA